MPSCSRVYRNNHAAVMRADRVREKGSKRDKKIINVLCSQHNDITFVLRDHARQLHFRGMVIARLDFYFFPPEEQKLSDRIPPKKVYASTLFLA